MAIQLFNVGIKAAIVNDNRILLVKHATKGFWDVPGGRIDGSESTEQTLAREIAEELPGSRLSEIGEAVCVYRVPDFEFDDGSGLVLVVYRATVDVPHPIMLSKEHSEAQWFGFDEASKVGSHIVRETINALERQRTHG
jgi:8-oxo-dGTP pyrophosphatase MutT (NUDIX family)